MPPKSLVVVGMYTDLTDSRFAASSWALTAPMRHTANRALQQQPLRPNIPASNTKKFLFCTAKVKDALCNSGYNGSSCESMLMLQHCESLQQAPFAGSDSNAVRGKHFFSGIHNQRMWCRACRISILFTFYTLHPVLRCHPVCILNSCYAYPAIRSPLEAISV